ncbi:MAG: universal stress protein [Saprospiraceae bacterium]
MKTIIACTDFSPNSNNAVQYAAALAAEGKARLLLFHHFVYPAPATDLPEVYPTIFVDELEENAERRLTLLKTELAKTYQIQVESMVRSLSFSSDLEEVYTEQNAEMVVMGIHGQSAFANALFGNETAAAIRRSNLPLLVVPQGVVYHPIQKILFPFDGQTIPHSETLRPLLDLAQAFDAYIEVFTLFDLQKTPELAALDAAVRINIQLEPLLAGTRHGYSAENEEHVDQGILYEATRSSADLVAMISHHHSFWSTLFNRSDTQRIAASILLPLLVMGEETIELGSTK